MRIINLKKNEILEKILNKIDLDKKQKFYS